MKKTGSESSENSGIVIDATAAEIGQVFGVSARMIGKWRSAGMPCVAPGRRGRRGRWDLAAIVAWWRDNVLLATDPDADSTTRSEAERRRAWARAKREELALEIEAGEYASVDEMIRMTRRADTAAIALWEQSPDYLVGLLPGRPTGKEKRAFHAAASRHVANVIEAQRQGLIDLLGEYEREADTPQPTRKKKTE